MSGDSGKTAKQSGHGQWPAGANAGPVRPVYGCSCGAVSSAPIKHDHTGGKR
ncbi:hypothetical protein ACQPZZ_29040 [Microbispora sp. CA-135349]|uniref:hypothetical protein n=1 Tax=Microbispora sp. CA-135349 TaxID=3239953 RepID=UPI003D93E372